MYKHAVKNSFKVSYCNIAVYLTIVYFKITLTLFSFNLLKVLLKIFLMPILKCSNK